MAEMLEITMPHPEADAKNLFVCDEKRNNYCMITVKGDKKADLKEFRRVFSTGALSFVPEGEMFDTIGLTPGSVSPLGLLNDNERKVHLFIDDELAVNGGLVGIHPNDNTATLWIGTDDLVKIIRQHGNKADIVHIPVRK